MAGPLDSSSNRLVGVAPGGGCNSTYILWGESSSFLKKRTKKLLDVWVRASGNAQANE